MAESVPVPVIAHGGAGSVDHAAQVVDDGRADAVCVASLLHYGRLGRRPAGDLDVSAEGNIEFLRRGREFTNVRAASIPELKARLVSAEVECR
jgi:cyclase